eukprot:365983-Chlamydomonas_euryale.AAC.23
MPDAHKYVPAPSPRQRINTFPRPRCVRAASLLESQQLRSAAFGAFTAASAALGIAALVAPGLLLSVALPGVQASSLHEPFVRIAGATMAASAAVEYGIKVSNKQQSTKPVTLVPAKHGAFQPHHANQHVLRSGCQRGPVQTLKAIANQCDRPMRACSNQETICKRDRRMRAWSNPETICKRDRRMSAWSNPETTCK